jgi:glycerophosphoryl diester phosphodiesterase
MTAKLAPCVSALLGPIAHRGLHDSAAGVIENSREAFGAAIAARVGIECDLQPSAGGVPVVFHDATLNRLMAADGRIATLSVAELQAVKYRGDISASDLSRCAPIMTFGDALSLVAGRVPLLVEIKSDWTPPDRVFLGQIAGFAASYRGPLALMSFDPAVMVALRDLAPEVPRGLVSGSYRSTDGDNWWADQLSSVRAAQLRDLADLDSIAASFIAYEVSALGTAPVMAAQARGLPVFAWTVRTQDDWASVRTARAHPIFEGAIPRDPA